MKPAKYPIRLACSLGLLGGVSVLLAGCGGGTSISTDPPPPVSIAIQGKLMSGQQPVMNASVQMYAAGSTGYGAGAVALGSAAETGTDGSFSIDSGYSCPASDSPVYLVARGGAVAQTGGGSSNPAFVLLAAVGSCGSIDTSTTVMVNEVSTTAVAYALAAFLGADAQIGSSATNSLGLKNAFANVANLVDPATGTSPGKPAPAKAVVPTAKLNTLAGILSQCSASTAVCNTLLGAATSTSSGGVPSSVPSNTLEAVANIARNPAANVATIFALAPAAPPFTPALSVAPPDWTLAISYSGGGLNEPTAIGLDSSGDIWAANYNSAVTELSAAGAPLSPAAGYTGGGLEESYGLAIDGKGNVWVTNEQGPSGVNGGYGSVTKLSSSGQVLSVAGGYTQGGISFPDAVAADANGSIWIANTGDGTATLLNADGSAVSGSGGYGSGSIAFPAAVAVDANHNAWFADQGSGAVTEVSPGGAVVRQVACCDEASGIAVDQSNTFWIANAFGNSVSRVDSSGTVLSSGYTAPSIDHPNGIAVDGVGNVWVANYFGNSISEILGQGTGQAGTVIAPTTGYGKDAGLNGPYGIAVDASGDVWVSNSGANTLTNFLGLAMPVKTPLLGPPALP